MTLSEPAWLTGARRALVRLEIYIAGYSLLLLLVLIFGQVIARNFLETSIPAADILSRYLVLYVTFFGAVLAVEAQQHIRIDVISIWLSRRWIRRLRTPLYLIAAGLCALFAWAAVRFWYDDWQYVAPNERWTSVLGLVIPAGFSLLALQFLLGGIFGPVAESDR
jgi:TRAP-type C4-dicarboxylate transport system permease small subunit